LASHHGRGLRSHWHGRSQRHRNEGTTPHPHRDVAPGRTFADLALVGLWRGHCGGFVGLHERHKQQLPLQTQMGTSVRLSPFPTTLTMATVSMLLNPVPIVCRRMNWRATVSTVCTNWTELSTKRIFSRQSRIYRGHVFWILGLDQVLNPLVTEAKVRKEYGRYRLPMTMRMRW
jgi:hypothetical protein